MGYLVLCEVTVTDCLWIMTVAVDSDSSPVSVSWSGDSRRNVIVWMDHRAIEQAERINSSKSPILEYCGAAVSPEMEPPKVLSKPVPLFHYWSLYILYCLVTYIVSILAYMPFVVKFLDAYLLMAMITESFK